MDSLDLSSSSDSSDSPFDTPESLSDWCSRRFWSSVFLAFLFTSLPRGSWQRLWRVLLLGSGVWYTGAMWGGEQLVSEGVLTPGIGFPALHERLVRAGRLFPLEDRFAKAAAYADASVAIDPAVALADFDYALRFDPYAPDLLQAKVWFLLSTGQREQAEQAAHTLYATEGCIDCWLLKQ